MLSRGSIRWALLGLLALAPGARSDEFEKIEGAALAGVPQSKDAKARTSLTLADIDALPNVLRDTRSALLVAKTDQGNYVRLLVSPAFRKAPAADAMMPSRALKKGKEPPETPPIPVVVLERFDTFEGGNIANRLAHGKDVILFDGFQFDLDSGQVVPEGQGGDLQFLSKGEGGPRLTALGPAKLFSLEKSPVPPARGTGRKSIGRAVLPTDFGGRYQLVANGQWSGALDLEVGDDRAVSGRFRSDLNGASYPVTGEVAADVPQKITFRVKFPRTHQDYEGLLWSEGKGAMAGTLTMQERAYGFFAIRDGARFAPEGDDVGLVGKTAPELPHRKAVTLQKGQYTLDGKPRTDQELTDALKKACAAEPETWVLLQVPADETFAAVNRAFEVIGAAGITSIRLGPAD